MKIGVAYIKVTVGCDGRHLILKTLHVQYLLALVPLRLIRLFPKLLAVIVVVVVFTISLYCLSIGTALLPWHKYWM